MWDRGMQKNLLSPQRTRHLPVSPVPAGPEHTEQEETRDKDSPSPSPNPQTPPPPPPPPQHENKADVALSPAGHIWGFLQPQLADVCPILFEVFSLIQHPVRSCFSKLTWGWWKKALRSPPAAWWKLSWVSPLLPTSGFSERLLSSACCIRDSIPKITLSSPQPHQSLQSSSRDTDSLEVPWDCRTCGLRGTQTD